MEYTKLAVVQQQTGEQFSTFGEGVETFKQINNRPVEPSAQPAVQTRTQFTPRPAVPAVTTATFQPPQPIRAAPAAPTPIEFPNALPAPAEQHDAQVFTRRPLTGTPSQAIPVALQQQRAQPQQPQQSQQSAEALRVQQENERLQAETLRIQQENQRIKAENQRIQQENLRFRQETQQSQQQPDSQRFQQAQHQIQEQFVSQLDELPQQEVVRTAPVVAQPTRSRGATRRPIAVLDAAPKPAAPVRTTPIRVVSAAPVRAEAAVAVNPEEEALFEEQAKNAQYTFASSVDDKLTDNSQLRQETRDGLNLAGLYSYSDGFFRRTVHYEADENGYRVVKEEVEPIGDGPQLNPNGAAEVQAQISGQNFGYRITADDIKERKETEKVPVQQGRFRQEQEFSR
ncbi:RNA polymerase II degradation factor 1 [Thrips palmi]|uniref:RNA polymerase II degradation factor 1 n=1 Tax=Thrips palmi TaxID=161013 RepID=A0A6P8ZBC7_THRPL|nr:RNA polymerase II degradation factor 1 [Thrips palmi]